MFDTLCPACQKRQLIFPSQISAIINDDQGIVALFTCWCGALGAERLKTVQTETATSLEDHVLAS